MSLQIWVLLNFWIVNFKSPGSLKRTGHIAPSWNQLMEEVDFSLLCPECQVIRVPRSRHCYMCGCCVSRFDHHCEWVNNCIGSGNSFWFQTYIWSMMIFIVATLLAEIGLIYLATECSFYGTYCRDSDSNQTPYNGPITTVSIVSLAAQSIIYVIFVIPLGALIWIQAQNYYYGLTTNERFGRDALKLIEQVQNFGIKENKLQALSLSVLERDLKYTDGSMDSIRFNYSYLSKLDRTYSSNQIESPSNNSVPKEEMRTQSAILAEAIGKDASMGQSTR